MSYSLSLRMLLSLAAKNNNKNDRILLKLHGHGFKYEDFSRKFDLEIQRNSKVRIMEEDRARKVSVPIVILPFGRLIIIGCRPDWKVEISKLSIPRLWEIRSRRGEQK